MLNLGVCRYVIFAIGSLSFLLVSISGTTVSVAFPDITSQLHTSIILASWVLGVNQLASTAVMPLAGKIGDVFGPKKIFLISIAVFTLGSFFAAIAPSAGILIAARFLQALGMGSFLPLATAIVSDYFPNSRQQAIGLFSSIMPIGMIIGPNIGGWLVQSFGWRSVFWLNIPLGVLVFFAVLFIFKPLRATGGKIDLLGAGLFTGALSGLLIGLSEIGTRRDTAAWIIFITLTILSVLFFWLFLRHEKRQKEPIIDLRMLRERPFSAANYFNLIYGAAVLGLTSFTPLYARSILGMSTLASGLILTPRSVGTMLASVTTSMLLPKVGYRGPMLLGVIVSAASLGALSMEFISASFLGIHWSGAVIMGIIMFTSGAGMGMIAPAANNACIDLLPEHIATITGIRGMFRQAGSAVSIAVTSMVLENFPSIAAGFRVVSLTLGAVLLGSIPFIYMMPRSIGAPGRPAVKPI